MRDRLVFGRAICAEASRLTQPEADMADDFTADQKRYLEGFVSGVQAARSAQGLAPIGGGGAAVAGPAQHEGPDAIHLEAQDRTIAARQEARRPGEVEARGTPVRRLCPLQGAGRGGPVPKPADNFRWRYHGLFYVAPAQDSYMCRLRIPNGILKALAVRRAWPTSPSGSAAATRMSPPAPISRSARSRRANAVELVEGLQDLGLTAKGSGADNIRNVTGDATAGIDPQALLDTRPYAREWHHHILNERSLYGLPRKFNVAFDGGGRVPTLEDTNDIGFQAVEVTEGAGVEPGVWFRLALGGITGTRISRATPASWCGPARATKVADAIVRVFIREGDRTNRTKARLKYVLDAWGFEKFFAEVEAEARCAARAGRRGRRAAATQRRTGKPISASTSRCSRA